MARKLSEEMLATLYELDNNSFASECNYKYCLEIKAAELDQQRFTNCRSITMTSL